MNWSCRHANTGNGRRATANKRPLIFAVDFFPVSSWKIGARTCCLYVPYSSKYVGIFACTRYRNLARVCFPSLLTIFFMARDKVIYGLQISSVNPHLLHRRTKPIHPYSSSFFNPMSSLEVINFLSLFQTPTHLARLLSQFPTKSRSNSSNVRVFESSPDRERCSLFFFSQGIRNV